MNRTQFGGALAKYLLLLLALFALGGYFYWKASYGVIGSVIPIPDSTANSIVFVRQDDNGQTQLYLAKSDGSVEPRPLTNDKGSKQAPAWSPDGKQISYVAEPDQGGQVEHTFQLFLLGAGQPQRITTGSIAKGMPQWRPDGREIAYLSGGAIKTIEPNGRPGDQIYPLPRKGSQQSDDSSGGGQSSDDESNSATKTPPVIYYRWASNSASIAVIHEMEGENAFVPGDPDWYKKQKGSSGAEPSQVLEPEAILVVPAVGGKDIYPLERAQANRVGFAWFSDGKRMVVSRSGARDKVHAVLVYRADDPHTEPTVLFGAVGYTVAPQNPAVTLDGKQVAFEVWRMTSAEDRELMGIAVMPADAETVAIRTKADMDKVPLKIKGHAMNPQWSPDGTHLVYTLTGPNGRRDIWVANADGSHAVNLTQGKGDNFDPAWSPALR